MELERKDSIEIEEIKQKPDKFDRQVRLWGARGQRVIGTSNVLLLGCDAVGVETLKNLVLPGVGTITIVDYRVIDQRDLGRNFFVSAKDLGNPIAKIVCENLLEMNPEDVKGNFIQRNPSEAAKDKEFLTQNNFDLVIANEMLDSDLAHLSQILFNHDIKLVIVNTYGFIGRMRTQSSKIHTVTEPKLQNLNQAQRDLRIIQPFEELQQYVDSFDLNNLQRFGKVNKQIKKVETSVEQQQAFKELSHVPYIVLIMKALEKYRTINEFPNQYGILQQRENIPRQYNAKKHQFNERESICNILKDEKNYLYYEDQENYLEALANCKTWIYKYQHPNLENNLQHVFSHELCQKADKNSDKFWILARAVQIFHQRNGFLPYPNNDVPDMQSDTKSYLRLKQTYKNKFEKDTSQVKIIIEEITGLKNFIRDDDVKVFLNNILELDYREFKSYEQELNNPNFDDLQGLTYSSDIHFWYVSMRATSEFLQENQRYPSVEKENDVQQLNQKILNIFATKLPQIEIDQAKSIDYAKEFCRYEDCKLHNISSLIGGLAAQECVKLLMHTFFPLNNTYIYNGTNGSGANVEM